MKNYYEILQVSKNASKEIIEKAYKTLAKTYHPDVQQDENKKTAEEKMKQINEAYEILSDDVKRNNYDIELEEEEKREKQEEISQIKRQVREQQNNNQYVNNNIHYNTDYNEQQSYDNTQEDQYYDNEQEQQTYTRAEWIKEKRRIRKQRREERERQEREYVHYMRSLGYDIKERWTFKKTKTLVLVIVVLTAALWIAWLIPPSHDAMQDLYNDNVFIRVIVDIVIGIVKGIFIGIYKFFKMLFTKS